MRDSPTYKKAKSIRPGHMICFAGYEDCPHGDENHYHCAKCGGTTGMFGHYAGGGKFTCEMTDKEFKAWQDGILAGIRSHNG